MDAMDHTASTASPDVAEPDRPFGPVAAAFLAAGFGAFVIGLMTTLAEANDSLSEWLIWSDPVGPLSGKTLVGVIAFVVAWAVLHVALRRRDVSHRTVYWVTAVLVILGVVGTFPIFFELFAPE